MASETYDTDEFAFKDLKVVVGGKKIIGLRGLMWREFDEDELIHGAGGKVIGIGTGNRSNEVTVKMTLGSYMKLKKSLGVNSVLDVRFDIAVVFAKNQGDKQAYRYIQGFKTSEDKEDLNSGDKFAEIEMSGLALKIKQTYN